MFIRLAAALLMETFECLKLFKFVKSVMFIRLAAASMVRTEGLSKPPKDWLPPPRPSDNAAAYIEVIFITSLLNEGGQCGAVSCKCCLKNILVLTFGYLRWVFL